MSALAAFTLVILCPMPLRSDNTPILEDEVSVWEWKISKGGKQFSTVNWINEVSIIAGENVVVCAQCRPVMKSGPQGPFSNNLCTISLDND